MHMKDQTNRPEIIKFRPHHFMCTISFRGKGYSLGFVKNYKKIAKQLNEDENTIIEVVEYMDDICSPCPNRLDDVICKTQDKILKLDKNHKESLELETGQQMTWKEAKNLIKEKMTIEKFHKSCDGCSWKKYGVCQQALIELKEADI